MIAIKCRSIAEFYVFYYSKTVVCGIFLISYKSYFQCVIESIMYGSLVAMLLHYSQVAALYLVQCQCISDLAILSTTWIIYLLWVQMLTLKKIKKQQQQQRIKIPNCNRPINFFFSTKNSNQITPPKQATETIKPSKIKTV